MSRIILHIGTHKTATTSVQRGLSRNREVLKERGIWYPDYELIGKRNHYAHLGIVNAFSHAHPEMTREEAIAYFAAVSEGARDYDVTIISAEPFFRHVIHGKNGKSAKPSFYTSLYWEQRNAYIEDVRAHFPHDNVDIAMVVRRQVDYGPSLYQEHVKTSRYTCDYAHFRKNFWPRFDYLRQARAWRDVFGTLRLARFEDLVRAPDLLDAFGTLIGADLGNLDPAPVQNESLPPDLVIWKRLLNRSPRKEAVIRKMVMRLGESAVMDKLGDLKGRTFYNDIEEMREFHDSFADANELLKREFMPEGAQDAPMFSDTLRDDLMFGDELHPTFLEALTEVLLGDKVTVPSDS